MIHYYWLYMVVYLMIVSSDYSYYYPLWGTPINQATSPRACRVPRAPNKCLYMCYIPRYTAVTEDRNIVI